LRAMKSDFRLLAEKLIEAGIAKPEHIRGLSPEAISSKESLFKISLPDEYKEFLLVMGLEHGWFMYDATLYWGNRFWFNQRRAAPDPKVKALPGVSARKLQEGDFVFAYHHHWYLFFNLKSKNPPIYKYTNGDPAPELVAESFLQWLSGAVDQAMTEYNDWKELHRKPLPESFLSDYERLQGAWLIRYTRNRKNTGCRRNCTHYVFKGNELYLYCPSSVDPWWLDCEFKLDETCEPKRISLFNERNQLMVYRLSDGTLELCNSPEKNSFPPGFDVEADYCDEIIILERDQGELPQSKRKSDVSPIFDKDFGQLCWNDDRDWFAGSVLFKGREVELYLQPESPADVAVAVSRLKSYVKKLKDYDRRAKEYICQEMLELKNSNWLDDGQKAYTPKGFMAGLHLESISVDFNGGIQLSYDADYLLFFGHGILLSLDERDQFSNAHLAG